MSGRPARRVSHAMRRGNLQPARVVARRVVRHERGGRMASKYGAKAQQKVERALHERKAGTLRSGGSGKKVTSRKQAIAIGLSEARRAGGKVPSRPSAGRRRGAAKKK